MTDKPQSTGTVAELLVRAVLHNGAKQQTLEERHEIGRKLVAWAESQQALRTAEEKTLSDAQIIRELL